MIPTPLPKLQLLHQLQKQRIDAEIKDPWLFPQRRAVGGFLGTGPLVIVGWRPSPSAFPDDGANRLFYDILTEYGVENAHLTNVVKSRGRKGESDPEDLALHEEIFLRELEIVNGLQAVAPMGTAYDRIAALLLKRGAKPIYRLRQYASMISGPIRSPPFGARFLISQQSHGAIDGFRSCVRVRSPSHQNSDSRYQRTMRHEE